MNPKRGWIAGVSLLVVVGLAVGFIWWQNNERTCDRWREDFRAVANDVEDKMGEGTFGKAEDSPLGQRLVKLVTEQPDGCPEPDTAFNELFDQTDFSD